MNTLKDIKAKIGEEIVWRRDLEVGWLRKKTISADIVSNYRAISHTGQQLYFRQIDDIVAINNRSESAQSFNAVGSRGSFRYTMGSGKGKNVTFGDVHFLSSVSHDVIFYSVADSTNFVRLCKSLKEQDAYGKQIERQNKAKQDKEGNVS